MPSQPIKVDVIPYEKILDNDWGRALSEGSRFFEEKSAVQDSLPRARPRTLRPIDHRHH